MSNSKKRYSDEIRIKDPQKNKKKDKYNNWNKVKVTRDRGCNGNCDLCPYFSEECLD